MSSPWPYTFLTLSDAEKLHRRELLDHYAFIAQTSALLPLLVLQLHFLASQLWARHTNANALTPPSSPRIKQARGGAAGDIWRARWWRRLRWWMGGKVVLGGDVLGSRGEVIGAMGWMLWLIGLSVVGTGRDYLHLTKRLGIVAASQLPFHYLLALKSPYSPIQYLTARSHESLNTLHQLLGRIITWLIYGHAALYLNFYVQNDLLQSKLREGYVIAGVVGVLAFTAVGTTALAPVRRWRYRVFYTVHVVLATLLLPMLWFHVSHIRTYVYETIVVYALNVLLRSLSSKIVPAALRFRESGTLVEIRIPLASAGLQKTALQHYHPGQHAYISLPGHPASRTFRSNPFSVASRPTVDNELRFVARVLDGNTAALATTAKAFDSSRQPLTIEGPYGVSTHADKLLQCDRVLFVAGGVGGTFIAPLYRQLLADLSPSAGSHRRQKVSFVWIARTLEDVEWALPLDGGDSEGFRERLQVWITGVDQHSGRALAGEEEEGVELRESKGLLQEANCSLTGSSAASKLDVRHGRPDFRRLVDDAFSSGIDGKIGVMVCGPQSLSSSLRDEISPWVRRGRDVWFWEESFAM